MTESIYNQLPECVIIDGRDYSQALSMTGLGFKLCKDDAYTIIESLVSKFLTMNDPTVLDYQVDMPDFNRMRDVTIKDDPTRLQQLMLAIQAIEQSLYVNFERMGLFEENKQFSYMLDRMLGTDIVIFKLPH